MTTQSTPPTDQPESGRTTPTGSGRQQGFFGRYKVALGIGGVAVVAVIAVVVVVFANGMIGGGSGTSDLQNVILEDSSSVSVVNVAAIMAAEEVPAQLPNFVSWRVPSIDDDYDPVDWKDEWRDDWEGDNEDFGFTLDEIEDLVLVRGQFSYFVATGSFLLGDLRDSLEDDGFEEDEYRDLEIWKDSGTAVGLLESGGKRMVIVGDVDDVQAVLRAVDREQGFLEDESALKQALDSAGNSLALNSYTECSSNFFNTSLRGCDASVEAITGGDLDTTHLSAGYFFSSDRRAESGIEDIEDAIEDQDYYDVDLEEIQISGLTVTHKVTIYEN